MSALKYVFILILLTGLSGISMASEVVATVNGKKITKQELDRYFKFRQATTRQDISHDKMAVLQELINRKLLLAEVKKKKIDQNKDLKYLIQQETDQLYIKALLRDTDAAKPVSDDEVKKIYDEKVKHHKVKEYKISHILMKSEQAAKDIIAELDGGAKFSDVAKKKSTGPSAKEGGELGWLNSGQLNKMPSFAQAVSELKKGSYTKQPVKTQYGWHVVKLEDEREVPPPTLKQLRPQIIAAIRRQRMAEFVKGLRDSAKVDIKMK
jgi:peptidyl-prolyl cis-trans isomerase C